MPLPLPLRAIRRITLLSALLALAVGCPHRAPVWSPDGSRIIVLTGKAGEDVDKAASQIWLVDAESGKAAQLSCPDKGVRYLSSAWLDSASFVTLTGKWEGGFVEAGSERIWRVSEHGTKWDLVRAPPPNETNATKRPPVVIRSGKDAAIVYPSDAEAVVVVEVETGKEILRIESAELVGPGPSGGFIASRPQPEDSSTIEVAAFGADLKILWRQKLSQLREGISKKLGKQPVDIVFNTSSTSQLPPKGEEGWVGLTLVFSDVGWKDGIPGYHVKLDEKTGGVLAAVRAVGLSGRPSIVAGRIWAVLAPDAKAKLSIRIATIQAEDGKIIASTPLEGVEKENVYGYALDPAGKRFALSLTGSVPTLRIYSDAQAAPRIINLK